jgi:hypothetical protein
MLPSHHPVINCNSPQSSRPRTHPSIHPSVPHPSICPFLHLSICPFVHFSISPRASLPTAQARPRPRPPSSRQLKAPRTPPTTLPTGVAEDGEREDEEEDGKGDGRERREAKCGPAGN